MSPKRFFFIFAGLITAITCAGLALYVTKQQSLAADINELEKLHADNQVAKEQLADLIDLKAQYEQVAPLSDRVDLILPDDKAQSEATAELAAIARGLNLPFNSLNYENTSGLPSATSQTETGSISNVRVMAATFSTTGTYGQLRGFLRSIEDNLRHIEVNSIGITRESSGLLKAAITVDIYLKS